MQNAIQRTLLSCLLYSIIALVLPVHAQIFVDSTGSNGFGDLPHPQAKSRFSNADHEYNLFVRSTGVDTVRGVGIYNFIGSGLADKYGIWNHIEQAEGATGLTYGLRNVVTHGGDQDAYGLYNDLSNTDRARGRIFGSYSVIDDRGARAQNKLFANFYGETVHRRRNNAYGSYLEVRSLTGDATKNSYGQYIDVRGGGAATRYGLYSNINGGSGYAGYFVGDVHINGTLTQASDEKLKENIDELDGALDKIMALQPHTYNYKPDEALGFGKEKRVHYGFLAQEVAKVLPDLVTEVHHTYHGEGAEIATAERVDELGFPSVKGSDAKSVGEEAVGAADISAVRYMDMIALLVGAVQEQAIIIDQREQEVRNARSEIVQLQNTVAQLVQEVREMKVCSPCAESGLPRKADGTGTDGLQLFPNPAKEYFSIVNTDSGYDELLVEMFTATGNSIGQIITLRDSIQISTAHLTSGTYFVKLYSRDGVLVDTKTVLIQQ